MGDPRRLKKKYKKPKRLWDKERIKEESKLMRKYGLKNMRELWIATAELRKVRREARRLLALSEEERVQLSKNILNKLNRLNILPETAGIDDILSLSVESFLERRLQTLVYKKGLAKTIKQARQLITHGFIAVNGRKVTSPGTIITKALEDKIGYYKPINLEPPTQVEKEEQPKESNEEKQEVVEEKGQESQSEEVKEE